jgi:hypothetical protein
MAMTHPDGKPESSGDAIFLPADRQDQLYAQLNRKINRLGRRITALEERGRE